MVKKTGRKFDDVGCALVFGWIAVATVIWASPETPVGEDLAMLRRKIPMTATRVFPC